MGESFHTSDVTWLDIVVGTAVGAVQVNDSVLDLAPVLTGQVNDPVQASVCVDVPLIVVVWNVLVLVVRLLVTVVVDT